LGDAGAWVPVVVYDLENTGTSLPGAYPSVRTIVTPEFKIAFSAVTTASDSVVQWPESGGVVPSK
jgi:hypothetical protein